MASEVPLGEVADGSELLERVEQLTAAIDAAADPFLRGTVDDLVGAIIELYGEGLTRIFRELAEHDQEALLRRLAGDGVIGSLMLIHDLYPVPLEARVQEALASVRPYMESHGGDVELLRLEDGVAHLRLVGHCHGCPASAATLESWGRWRCWATPAPASGDPCRRPPGRQRHRPRSADRCGRETPNGR